MFLRNEIFSESSFILTTIRFLFAHHIMTSHSSKLQKSKTHLLSGWSPGLDFINVLCTAFTPVVPQSVRTQSSRQYLFTLLGPTSVKAVRRTLMKWTPGFDKGPMAEKKFRKRSSFGSKSVPTVNSPLRKSIEDSGIFTRIKASKI